MNYLLSYDIDVRDSDYHFIMSLKSFLYSFAEVIIASNNNNELRMNRNRQENEAQSSEE